jgi:hypothetical protein
MERHDSGAFSRLQHAAKSGDVDALRSAAAAGADVNAETQNQGTLLMDGVLERWSIDVMRALVEAGTLLDKQDGEGNTAVYYASQEGNLDHLEFLLLAGADPNIANVEGQTPLMATYDNIQILQPLLDAGSLVNACDSEGKTCLHFSTRWLYLPEVEALLVQGADPRIRDKEGLTPYQCAPIADRLSLRPLFDWTPFKMLPAIWSEQAFPLFIDHCPGFKGAIITALLVFVRYRWVIPRGIDKQIIAFIAQGHRQEQWWEIEGFIMDPYM